MDDEDLTDPFADDVTLSFMTVHLGSAEQVQARLKGDSWTESGYGATQDEATDDLRQTIVSQPDDADVRAVKLAALATALSTDNVSREIFGEDGAAVDAD